MAQKAYIGTCISTYNTLALNGLRNYKHEAKKIQEELLAHRALGRSVGKKAEDSYLDDFAFVFWI